MKIVHYTPRFFPDPRVGGRAVSVKNFSLALARRGFNVIIVSHWEGDVDSYVIDGVPVIRASKLYNNRLLDYVFRPVAESSVLRILLKTAVQGVLHVHGPTYGFRVPPRRPIYTYRGWQRLRGEVPIVYTFEGSLEPNPEYHFPGYSLFERNAVEEASSADFVVALNSKTARVFREKAPHVEVEVIYNFVDKTFFEQYREEYPSVFTVLYVGGSSAAKGYRDALAVRSLLQKRGVKANFLLIGPGLKMVPHEEMPSIYLSSTVLLFPSYREGLPMSVIEAQALGRPVVGTDVGGMPDIVVHGETGFLAKPGDVNAMADFLTRLAEDPGLVERMGRAARRHTYTSFSEEAVVPRLINVYTRLKGKG